MITFELGKKYCVKQIDLHHIADQNNLKTLYLYFDQILYDKVLFKRTTRFLSSKTDVLDRIYDEINFLKDQNILSEYSTSSINDYIDLESKITPITSKTAIERFLEYKDNNHSQVQNLQSLEVNSKAEFDQKFLRYASLHSDLSVEFSRLFSSIINQMNGAEIFPIFNDGKLLKQASQKNNVVEVTLNNFPIIDKVVPWKDLIAFKTESNAVRKLYRLRSWINDLGNSDLSRNDIQDQIQHLMTEYEYEFKLAHLKYKTSKMKIVLNGTASLLENLIKFRFANIANSVFTLQEKKINLLETE